MAIKHEQKVKTRPKENTFHLMQGIQIDLLCILGHFLKSQSSLSFVYINMGFNICIIEVVRSLHLGSHADKLGSISVCTMSSIGFISSVCSNFSL